MARYVNRIQTPMDPAPLIQPIGDYLIREGFSQINYNGGVVWKKGVGLMTAPQYISLAFGPNYIQVEAFIKYALVPGVYVGEMGTDGFFGALPKQLLKGRVATIEQYIYSLWQSQNNQQA